MAADTFTPRDLKMIVELAAPIAEYNRRSGEDGLFAVVRFYRKGRHVASLTEARGDVARNDSTELMFEVEEDV